MARSNPMIRVLEALPPAALARLGQLHDRLPAARRLTSRLRDGARRRPATLRYGELAGIQLCSTTAAVGYNFGRHELELQHALASSLREGDTFFDIGAHIGLMSLVGARKVGGSGLVYAFEPEPGSAEQVRRNAALNRFGQLQVLEKAAWSSQGMGTLVLPDGHSEYALVVDPDAAVAGQPSRRVELVSVDELVRGGALAPPSVVKIDVQHAEGEVLRGMRETLERHRPLVFCELHGSAATVIPQLRDYGYEPRKLDRRPLDQSPAFGEQLRAEPAAPTP